MFVNKIWKKYENNAGEKIADFKSLLTSLEDERSQYLNKIKETNFYLKEKYGGDSNFDSIRGIEVNFHPLNLNKFFLKNF